MSITVVWADYEASPPHIMATCEVADIRNLESELRSDTALGFWRFQSFGHLLHKNPEDIGQKHLLILSEIGACEKLSEGSHLTPHVK